MEIDKESTMEGFWLSFPDKTDFLKILRSEADAHSCNDNSEAEKRGYREALFTDDIIKFDANEYYIEDDGKSIHFSGDATTQHGAVYVSVTLPLSDKIYIDFLAHAVRRLNKMKTAMEALK